MVTRCAGLRNGAARRSSEPGANVSSSEPSKDGGPPQSAGSFGRVTVRGDCATVELKYVCNLSYRPKFYAGRYRDVAQAEYGSRDLHGGWNAGPGTRLDRSRTIAA